MSESKRAFPEPPGADDPLPDCSRRFRIETQDLASLTEQVGHAPALVLSLETVTLRAKLWACVSDVFWFLLIYLTLASVPFLLLVYLFELKHPAFVALWLAIALTAAGRWLSKQVNWGDVRFGPHRFWRTLHFHPLRIEEGRVSYSWRGRPEKAEATTRLGNCSVFAGCWENCDCRYWVVGIADDAALDQGFPDSYLTLFEHHAGGYGDLTDAEEARLRPLAEAFCRRSGLRYRAIRAAQSR